MEKLEGPIINIRQMEKGNKVFFKAHLVRLVCPVLILYQVLLPIFCDHSSLEVLRHLLISMKL